MDMGTTLITEPKEPTPLSSVEDLLKYQESFDTGFHFTDKEAELILDYMEGHGYMLGQANGVLYRGDMEEKQDETVWEEFPMDDVIDSCCEWNYELILDMDAQRQNASNLIDFGNSQNKYQNLKQDEIALVY